MATGMGNKSFLGVGTETSYGTWRAPIHKTEIINANISPVIGSIKDPSLYSGLFPRAIYAGGVIYKGNVTTRLNYESGAVWWMLESLLGTMSATNHTAGSNTFAWLENRNTSSLTLELSEGGDVPTANKTTRVLGAYVTGVTFRGEAGQGDGAMITAEWEVVAKTKTANFPQTTSGSAFPTARPILFSHAQAASAHVGFDIANASTYRIRNWELAIRAPLSEDRFYIGSVNPDAPLKTDFMSATWRYTLEYNSIVPFTQGVVSANDAMPTMHFKSGSFEWKFEGYAARVSEYSVPIEGYGVLMNNITLESFYNSGSAASLRVANTQTKASAASIDS